MSNRLVICITSVLISLTISVVNLYITLKPDKNFCEKYHLICTWGGGMAFDPQWYSQEAEMKRLIYSLKINEQPRLWKDSLTIDNKKGFQYPQKVP